MEQTEQSKRDISEKWINNNVYEALEEIERCYQRAIDGCVDLMEFIQQYSNDPNFIYVVQVQNLKRMLTLMHILIENVKQIMPSEKNYNDARNKLQKYSFYFYNGKPNDKKIESAYHYSMKNIHGRKSRAIMIDPLFMDIVKGMGELRSDMITYLKDILFIKGKPIKTKEI